MSRVLLDRELAYAAAQTPSKTHEEQCWCYLQVYARMSNDSAKDGGVDEGAIEESSVRVHGHRILNAVITSKSRSDLGRRRRRIGARSYLI